MRNDWLILHCLFRFILIFRSRLVLGCCETCAETRKSSSEINRVVQMKDEVEFKRNFRIYRAAGHFPDTVERVSRP